jgi:hypothetical protein
VLVLLGSMLHVMHAFLSKDKRGLLAMTLSNFTQTQHLQLACVQSCFAHLPIRCWCVTLHVCVSCSDEDASLPHSSSHPSMGGAPNTNSSSNLAAAAAAGGDGEPGSTNTSKPSTPLAGASAAAAGGDAAGLAGAGAAGSAAAGDALSKKRAYKEKWQEGIALFNSKPKKGIALLQVSRSEAGVAAGCWQTCTSVWGAWF